MTKPNWDIRNKAQTWSKDEAWQRFELLPDRAVQLGSPRVWRAAAAAVTD